MQVIVLKVRYQKNLDDLAQTIQRGRTLHGSDGGWRMPVTAQPGDLVIWYPASPDQEYVAYGLTAGLPSKREPTRQPYGPVAGVRPLPGGPIPRARVAAKPHRLRETNVGQLAGTMAEEIRRPVLVSLGL